MIRMAAAATYSVVPIFSATAPNERLLLTDIAAAATVQYVRFEPLARFIVALHRRAQHAAAVRLTHTIPGLAVKYVGKGYSWFDWHESHRYGRHLAKNLAIIIVFQGVFSGTNNVHCVRDRRSQLYRGTSQCIGFALATREITFIFVTHHSSCGKLWILQYFSDDTIILRFGRRNKFSFGSSKFAPSKLLAFAPAFGIVYFNCTHTKMLLAFYQHLIDFRAKINHGHRKINFGRYNVSSIFVCVVGKYRTANLHNARAHASNSSGHPVVLAIFQIDTMECAK